VNPGSFSIPSPNFSHLTTDSSAIFKSASTVNQKSGPAPNDKPDQPVNGTSVTVVDGKDVGSVPVDAAGSIQTRSIPGRLAVAARHGVHQDFTQVFAGTGTKPNDRDGSIEGTAYLTFTMVSNATYNVDDCLAFCRSVKGCGESSVPPFCLCSPSSIFSSLRRTSTFHVITALTRSFSISLRESLLRVQQPRSRRWVLQPQVCCVRRYPHRGRED
jgi:hypothetical protein